MNEQNVGSIIKSFSKILFWIVFLSLILLFFYKEISFFDDYKDLVKNYDGVSKDSSVYKVFVEAKKEIIRKVVFELVLTVILLLSTALSYFMIYGFGCMVENSNMKAGYFDDSVVEGGREDPFD